MICTIGIDPGESGAMALLRSDGRVLEVMDWKDVRTAWSTLQSWVLRHDVELIALEQVWAQKHDSKQSATTFQQHAGGWAWICEISGCRWVRVKPTEWMKRRIRAKVSRGDKPSVGYVELRYPEVELFGPRGGKKDGRSDAVCIAEWAMEQL